MVITVPFINRSFDGYPFINRSFTGHEGLSSRSALIVLEQSIAVELRAITPPAASPRLLVVRRCFTPAV